MAAARRWTHAIRFIAKEDGRIHLGQIDSKKFPDVGLAVLEGKEVEANCISGSVFDGVVTDRKLHVAHEHCTANRDQPRPAPFTVIDGADTVIRCLGLNYRDHAKEANMAIPDVPVLFIKPRTALNGPHPAKINIPKIAQDDTADYDAELAIVISKD
ncbi:hypothetical protein ACJ41O_006435 [Fusarium nematophilum]